MPTQAIKGLGLFSLLHQNVVSSASIAFYASCVPRCPLLIASNLYRGIILLSEQSASSNHLISPTLHCSRGESAFTNRALVGGDAVRLLPRPGVSRSKCCIGIHP